MLQTIPLRQAPPPRTSARRISSPRSPDLQNEPAHVSRQRRFGPLLLSLCFCLVGIGVYMWPRVQVVRLAYRLHTSEQHLSDLLQQRDHLRLEVTSLRDPERIYRIATEQLGMSTPRQDQVIIIAHDPMSR